MKMKKSRLIMAVCMASFALLIAAGGLLFRLNNFKIEFSVPTGETDIVEFGNSYAPPEVKAYLVGRFFYKSGKEINLERGGAADTSALGEYKLTWSASALGAKSAGVRTVNVVDTTPPVITLAPYDKEYIFVGANYEEAGYSAADNVDGDITGTVAVSEIDTSSPGEKEIVYTAADKSGNTVTAVRKITVKEKPKRNLNPVPQVPAVVPAPANGGVIYLTFDDGPGPYTAQLLDILAKYNVKATFFVTGRGDRSLIAREAREGHSVGIHSLTHNYSQIYANEEAFFADIDAMNEIIKEQTGSYANILRFPGGGSNTVSRKYCPGIMSRLTVAVGERGFKYFDWNVVSGDAGGTTNTDRVFLNVTNGIRGKAHSIVLQHDIKGFSVNAVERIIVWGLNNGYTFAPLTFDSPTVHQAVGN